MGTAEVVGFGGKSPAEVLEVLSAAVTEKAIASIVPKRSQNIELDLLNAPYRTFLSNTDSSSSQKNLIIYCLPSTVTEYMTFGSESSAIRSSILSGSGDVVAVFDTASSSFAGGDAKSILSALSGDNAEASAALASAALASLSKLDGLAASQLSPAGRNDIVIIVGSGGREHALAVAVARSPLVSQVVCCPGNGGTAVEGGKISNAEGVNGKQDNDTVLALVKRLGAHMVVVGPEAPLVDGLVNVLKEECPDVRAFGPTKEAAILEASKIQKEATALKNDTEICANNNAKNRVQ
eukprot:15366321-Ditylum_brightwellii.AAC.1